VGEVSELVKPEQMAVLFAPMKDKKGAAELLKKKDVEKFLVGYNYDRARLIVNALARNGARIPRVAMVGAKTPIEGSGVLEAKQVFVVDLDVKDEIETERRVIRLRSDLEVGKSDLSQVEPAVLQKLRAFFAVLAKTLDDLENATKAPEKTSKT